MRAILRREEPEEVYRKLVDGLAENVIPMYILCGLLLSSGGYVLSFGANSLILFATIVSAVASLLRIALILHHQKHREAYRRLPLATVRRLESLHAATSILTGLSVGFFSSSVFGCPLVVLHMIPICIVFGYSAGIIARASIRPRIAAGTLLSFGLPIVAALAARGREHQIVAAICFVFIGAGIQSISFVYKTTWEAVTLRLQVEALARIDPLTGLLNRLGLREACQALAQGVDQMVSVHAFDLDGFKSVNDTYGHAAGDKLLKILAQRIQSAVSQGAIVARTGGDEFVLVQLGGKEAAQQLAERILQQLTLPCDIGGSRRVKVGLSLGYASGLLSQTTFEDLSHKADALSYAAKRSGGGVCAGVDGSDETTPMPLMSASA